MAKRRYLSKTAEALQTSSDLQLVSYHDGDILRTIRTSKISQYLGKVRTTVPPLSFVSMVFEGKGIHWRAPL